MIIVGADFKPAPTVGGRKRELNDPGGSELVDWKSTLVPVILEAGIQAVFDRELKTNLHARRSPA